MGMKAALTLPTGFSTLGFYFKGLFVGDPLLNTLPIGLNAGITIRLNCL